MTTLSRSGYAEIKKGQAAGGELLRQLAIPKLCGLFIHGSPLCICLSWRDHRALRSGRNSLLGYLFEFHLHLAKIPRETI